MMDVEREFKDEVRAIYKTLDEARKTLFFRGIITNTENRNILKKMERWKKNYNFKVTLDIPSNIPIIGLCELGPKFKFR